MRAFQLVSTNGTSVINVEPGETLTVGRSGGTEIGSGAGPSTGPLISDSKVSRRHAAVTAVSDGLRIKDLGSRNGTFVNGTRIVDVVAVAGDVVIFGKTAFDVREVAVAGLDDRSARGGATAGTPSPEETILREVPIEQKLAFGQQAADATADMRDAVSGGTGDHAGQQLKLSLLLEISKELSKQPEVDGLLARVADVTLQVMRVDRVSILMLEGQENELIPRVSKERDDSSEGHRHVPRSIARRAVDERVAILTDDAGADARFGGRSVVAQGVRSAICAPLMGSEGNVLGIIYVDSRSPIHPLGDEDLDFLVAFSGIAAVAIENSQLIEQVEQKATILSNFRRYFAPSLAEQIADHTETVQLGGTRRPVVIFFSDIRGFTAMAERMDPDETASLLNEYLSAMVDIVFEYHGTLDKFVGDAIMALWGAPFAGEDDADRAMMAAIDMQRKLVGLNEKWAAEGHERLEIGIGINLGDVFVGNIGSDRRLEYTAIGDAVNTASRLCDQAGPGEIIVSKSVYDALVHPPAVEAAEPLALKGKAEPVAAFRVKH